MAHISVKDFYPKVKTDEFRRGIDEPSPTELGKSNGSDTGISENSTKGSEGANKLQEDTKTKLDGSSDVKVDDVAQSGANGTGGEVGKRSSKKGKRDEG